MILSTIPRRARLARRRAQAGFTLIELMVAMVVSAIVVLGVYAFSTIQQSTAGLHERNVRVQQALEGAMWTMAQDVRSAGLGFGRLCSELRVYDAAGGRLINPGAVAAPAQAYLDQVTNEAYWVLRDGLQAHWNSSVGASMVGTLNRSSDPNSVADSFDVILAEAAYTDSYGVFELSAVVDPADGYLVVEGSGMLDNNDPNHVAQVQQLFPPGSFFLLSRTPAAATNPMRPDFQGQCPLLQVTGDVVAEPGNVRQWRIPISGAVSGFDGDVATLLDTSLDVPDWGPAQDAQPGASIIPLGRLRWSRYEIDYTYPAVPYLVRYDIIGYVEGVDPNGLGGTDYPHCQAGQCTAAQLHLPGSANLRGRRGGTDDRGHAGRGGL